MNILENVFTGIWLKKYIAFDCNLGVVEGGPVHSSIEKILRNVCADVYNNISTIYNVWMYRLEPFPEGIKN